MRMSHLRQPLTMDHAALALTLLCRSVKPYMPPTTSVICVSKGIESGTLCLMKDILGVPPPLLRGTPRNRTVTSTAQLRSLCLCARPMAWPHC